MTVTSDTAGWEINTPGLLIQDWQAASPTHPQTNLAEYLHLYNLLSNLRFNLNLLKGKESSFYVKMLPLIGLM